MFRHYYELKNDIHLHHTIFYLLCNDIKTLDLK